MYKHSIRHMIARLGMTMVPVTVAAGCGNPCLDDGFGHLGARCDENLTAAAGETEDGESLDGGALDGESLDGGGEPDDGGVDGGSGTQEPFHPDADGDGFGDPDELVMADPMNPPPGHVPESLATDCDDADANTYPGAAEQESDTLCENDDDDDGWGDRSPGVGIVAGKDCDDESATTYPGAAANESPTACTKDDDGDGWGDADPPPGVDPGSDCADDDAASYGCDTLWCIDSDGDGFGDPDACVPGGAQPPSPDHVDNDDDCDDGDPAVRPGAATSEPRLCTADVDGDGFGPIVPPPGADAGSDCDDASAFAFPGASENEQAPLDTLCTLDADEDGYGDDTVAGSLLPGTDCDDSSANTFVGAAELDDAGSCMADEDLDGYGEAAPPSGVVSGQDCEDGDPTITICDQWCFDADNDGFGDGLTCMLAGSDPGPQWVQNGIDCLDANPSVYPGAAEAEPELCALDADGDGYGALNPPAGVDAGTDCSDVSAFAFPGASENESAPLDTQCTLDADEDGYGDDTVAGPIVAGTDCDDASVNTFVGAAELEDASACMNDDDLDGYGDSASLPGVVAGQDCEDGNPAVTLCGLWYFDGDGDGFGNPAISMPSLVDPGVQWVQDHTDCLDTDANVFPGAAPNDDPLGCLQDGDGDGYGNISPPAGVTAGVDCDDADPTFADCSCLAPADYIQCDGVAGLPVASPFQAIGIGCSLDLSQSMVTVSTNFASVLDVGTWEVFHQLGTAADPINPGIGLWSPRPDVGDPDAQHNAGNNLLMLSTGPIGVPGAGGVLVELPGSQVSGGLTLNPAGNAYPAPIVGINGSGGTPFEGCDGINDCSDSLAELNLPALGLNDRVFFQMELNVPAGVDGFRFDFAYFSSEYPDWVNTVYNDIFVVWVESDAFTGNVAVTPDGTPFTITELANAGEMSITAGDARLAGTGFEGFGGTGWRSVLAPVVPGELLRVSFLLADVGDAALSTAVLIDNFRWDCAGCDGVGDCGLTTLP